MGSERPLDQKLARDFVQVVLGPLTPEVIEPPLLQALSDFDSGTLNFLLAQVAVKLGHTPKELLPLIDISYNIARENLVGELARVAGEVLAKEERVNSARERTIEDDDDEEQAIVEAFLRELFG